MGFYFIRHVESVSWGPQSLSIPVECILFQSISYTTLLDVDNFLGIPSIVQMHLSMLEMPSKIINPLLKDDMTDDNIALLQRCLLSRPRNTEGLNQFCISVVRHLFATLCII